MVDKMRETANAVTSWLRDKLLPWLVIASICMLLTMAGSIIKLQGQIEQLRSEIQISMLQTMQKITENQVENSQLIIRTEAITKENRAMINMLMKALNGNAKGK